MECIFYDILSARAEPKPLYYHLPHYCSIAAHQISNEIWDHILSNAKCIIL